MRLFKLYPYAKAYLARTIPARAGTIGAKVVVEQLLGRVPNIAQRKVIRDTSNVRPIRKSDNGEE